MFLQKDFCTSFNYETLFINVTNKVYLHLLVFYWPNTLILLSMQQPWLLIWQSSRKDLHNSKCPTRAILERAAIYDKLFHLTPVHFFILF
jgi:hypothetical protein